MSLSLNINLLDIPSFAVKSIVDSLFLGLELPWTLLYLRSITAKPTFALTLAYWLSLLSEHQSHRCSHFRRQRWKMWLMRCTFAGAWTRVTLNTDNGWGIRAKQAFTRIWLCDRTVGSIVWSNVTWRHLFICLFLDIPVTLCTAFLFGLFLFNPLKDLSNCLSFCCWSGACLRVIIAQDSEQSCGLGPWGRFGKEQGVIGALAN